MEDPLNVFRVPLNSFEDVEKRCQHTEEIKNNLSLVHHGNWRALYRSKFDGSYWIEEYPFSEIHGGGPSCLYFVSAETSPDVMLENQPYLTSELRKIHDAKIYWDLLGDETGPEICKKDGCMRKKIALSAFCKIHHFENVRKEPCPFN